MKQDLRVEKTLSSLTDAFLALIEEKPLEKLSVTEICTLAKVSRVTYYNYFQDVFSQYDYLKKIYFDSSREFFRYEGSVQPGREETVELLTDWLNVLDEGVLGEIFAAIVRTQGVLGFLEEYHREIGRSVVGSLDENRDFVIPEKMETELVILFCEGGWTTLILKWLTEEKRTYTSRQIAECIIDMILKREDS